MKFSLIISLMAVGTIYGQGQNVIEDWTATGTECTADQDCKTTVYRCCDAAKAGQTTRKMCGAPATTTIPTADSTGVYGGGTFTCPAIAGATLLLV